MIILCLDCWHRFSQLTTAGQCPRCASSAVIPEPAQETRELHRGKGLDK
jgi:DNA-directed RNA polymerase subunit RPC12/RpoP